MSAINELNMLQVGTILHGTYKIESYLASGGFGNTYLAKNIEFDETYAIKEFFVKGVCQRDGNSTTISVSNAENTNSFEQQREKFKKEARRLRSLSNPHIVKVYDLFEENGTAYYVMDYVDGENLSARLKRTNAPLAESEVRNYLNQILDGLEAIHNKGMFHLDIKPANIMVDSHDVVKLIDFGASKQQSTVGGATMSTGISYTNGYAPSEQMAQSYDKFGPWTDFYALGATVYKLLTNQDPPSVSDLSEDETEDKHLALPMPNVSEEMKKLVVWMMQVNRLKRPKNVGEIETAKVGRLVDDYGMDDKSFEETVCEDKFQNTAKQRQNEKQVKRYKTLWLLLGILFLFFVIGGIWWISQPSKKEQYAKAECMIEGKIEENGVVVPADSVAALPVIQKLANAQYGPAMWMLAQYYANGSAGIPKDSTEAERLYKVAFPVLLKEAENGDMYSQCALSLLYGNGKGCAKNESMAFYWMEKSSEQEYDDALNNIGIMYVNGIGCKENPQKAFKCFQRAARLNSLGGQMFVASAYLNGYGVDVDTIKAISLYQKLSEKKYIPAKSQLGQIFFNQSKFDLALKYNLEAADENWESACLLGYAFLGGQGTKTNVDKALFYTTNAVDMSGGNPECLWLLGICYENKNDLNSAFQAYKASAEQNFANAQYKLAVYYQNGYGVKANQDTAQKWYDRAISNGYKDETVNTSQPAKRKKETSKKKSVSQKKNKNNQIKKGESWYYDSNGNLHWVKDGKVIW